jgi:hypothetical protein
MCHHCEHHQDQDCECEENSCGCGEDCCVGGVHFQRRYQTKAEQISDLEIYLSDLKQEVQAVEERLADLRK